MLACDSTRLDEITKEEMYSSFFWGKLRDVFFIIWKAFHRVFISLSSSKAVKCIMDFSNATCQWKSMPKFDELIHQAQVVQDLCLAVSIF